MIKCVVCDMDGTLLNNNKELPPNTMDVIKKLAKKNIKFIAASGRSYRILNSMFQEVDNLMTYICDNGAYVRFQDEIISNHVLSANELNYYHQILHDKDVYPVYCSANQAYITKEIDIDHDSLLAIKVYYPDLKIVTSFSDDQPLDIIKIAVFDPIGSANYIYPIMQQHQHDNCDIILSAFNWIDIQRTMINKGKALEKVRELFNYQADEVMVFGDYLNDLEMLKQVKFSYAPNTAHDEIKKIAYKIIGNNDDFSVIKEISKLINEESNLL